MLTSHVRSLCSVYVVHVYVKLSDPFVNLSIKNKSSKLLANIELLDNTMKVFYKTHDYH